MTGYEVGVVMAHTLQISLLTSDCTQSVNAMHGPDRPRSTLLENNWVFLRSTRVDDARECGAGLNGSGPSLNHVSFGTTCSSGGIK